MSLIPSAAFTRLRAGYSAAGAITANDPTTDTGLGGCNHLVTWTFAAVFLLVATSAFAQEQEKPPARSVSPDGKWEFRAGAAGEQDDFVIAKAGSDETSVVLTEEEYATHFAGPSETEPISNPKPYIKLHFPKTYAILYGG
jgi:hypothetical protein